MLHPPVLSTRQAHRASTRALIRLITAFALVVTGFVVVTPTVAQAANPGTIGFTKSGSGGVLLGGETDFTLTASNPASSSTEQYNLTFRDVLPVGVTYVPGSTTPDGIGDPQIITITDSTNPLRQHQVLIWENIADITPGSESSIRFSVNVDPAEFPIGSSVVNSGSAYASSDPYEVPDFNPTTGAPVTGTNITSASGSATTPVTAIRIDKGEGSPESELLRGVHDHQTVYTLTVTNNGEGPTTGLVVTDYLPAELEFLGCGGGTFLGEAEYPGANPSVAPVPGCPGDATLTSVETVSNPAGYPAGVYTKVTWTLGNLAAGGVGTISYGAGIPQRANTMTWADDVPSATGLDQAANLDNNNGASTREPTAERSLTNHAVVVGTFAGESRLARTTATVTAEDLRMRKGVTDADGGDVSFVQGGIATYSLTINTSEYADLSDLVIVDTIPAGLCPIDTGVPVGTLPADCAALLGSSTVENATIDSVVPIMTNGNISFRVTLKPNASALAHNDQLVIRYHALMRGFTDAGTASPTSALDGFTNSAQISGVSTIRDDVNPPESDTDPVDVQDTSSTTIGSGGPSIVKLRMKNATPMACAANNANGDYKESWESEAAFSEGDRVCFLLQVTFPAGVDTRNAQLTDFLPPNLTFESATVDFKTPSGATVGYAQTPATPTTYATWTLGSGSPRVVPKGSVLNIVLSARMTKPLPATSTPTKVLSGNLAKFRFNNSAGQSQSLRDSVDVPIGLPPTIETKKGVQTKNGQTIGGNYGGVDGVQVAGGDTVTFRVDLKNLTTTGAVNADTIASPDVWDVLPVGITCEMIGNITPVGTATCYNPGAPGRPTVSGVVSGASSRSLLRWVLPASFTLVPQEFKTLTYDMDIPTDVSVTTTFINTVAVASFTSPTNIAGTVAVHNPQSNINAAVPAADMDVPPATDDSNVFTPNATVAKAAVTAQTDAGNTAAQAVPGEVITYTISLRIPANTSVYKATLTDTFTAPVPSNVEVLSTEGFFSSTNVSPATGALPTGVSVTTTGGLTFPSSGYTNSGPTEHLFQVVIKARLQPGYTGTTSQANRARFVSYPSATSTAALANRDATATVAVVQPSPVLTKSNNAGAAYAGQPVTFTLNAYNSRVSATVARPSLYDPIVVDCLPAGFTYVEGSGTPVPTQLDAGAPGNTCAPNRVQLTWTIATLPGTGTATLNNTVITYQATAPTNAAGGAEYTNDATLTGSTLNNGVNDPVNERVFTVPANSKVTIAGSSVTKTPATSTATIGERVTWTVTATFQPNINYYNAAIIDTLPTSLDPTTLQYSVVGGDAGLVAAVYPLTTAGQKIGWGLGTVAAAGSVRTVQIQYSAIVKDATGVNAGTTWKNSVLTAWNLAPGANPTSAGDTLEKSSTPVEAQVTIIEPALVMSKAVSNATPAPGDTFTYTVSATNNGRAGANLSPAFNVTVVDTVPVGVEPQTYGGGTWDPVARTITWFHAGPIGVTAGSNSVSFSYTAKLAPSTTLTGESLVNKVSSPRYESLPADGRTSYTAAEEQASVTPAFPHVTPTKSAAAGPAYLGEPKTWTITLTNDGTSPAYAVDAVDTLPINWTYDSGSAQVVVAGVPSGQLEPALSFDANGKQVLTWLNLGTIPATGFKTAVITFTATPKNPEAITAPGVGSGTPHVNTVTTTARDANGDTHSAAPGGGSFAGPDATASTRIDSADVQIVKASDHNAVAGEDLTYTLTVTNNGGDTATGPFTVVDNLPAGVTNVRASGSGWTCSTSATTVSCARTTTTQTLASGVSFPVIEIKVGIPADTAVGTVLENTATVTSTTYDPELDNNADDVTDATTREIDLGVVKTTTSAVVAGEEVTYALNVTNHGSSDSAGPITVTDALPPGTTFVSAGDESTTEWQCGLDAGSITCVRDAGMPAGSAAAQIVVRLKLAANQTGNLVNTATVSGPANETDVNDKNDSSTVTDPIVTLADLKLTKSHTGDFTAGTKATYHFLVENLGPSDAAGALRIVDTLPAGIAFDQVLTDGWDCTASAGEVVCTRDDGLANGDSTELDIQVDVSPAMDPEQPILNTATVSSTTEDPNETNNVDTDDARVNRLVDLGIEKRHTPEPAEAGSPDPVVFTLTVTNHGPSDEPGVVTVTDLLPSALVFVSAGGSGWTCADPSADRVITCTLAGGLPAKQTSTITVRATVPADAGPATVVNTAEVGTTSGSADPDPDNNTDADPVTIVDRAELSITKKASPKTVVAGGTVVYTVEVSNAGPSDSDNVVVNDQLPAGLILDEVRPITAGVTCDASGGLVTCSKATLAANTSFTFEIEATVGSAVLAETIDNTATVTSGTLDTNPDDDTDTETIDIVTEADLSIAKSHTVESIVAGEMMTFDLLVTNAGLSDAQPQVVITDTLPVGMTYVGREGPWDCSAPDPEPGVPQVVTCTLSGDAGILAEMAAPVLKLTVQVDSALDPDALVDGKLANTATVKSGTKDPNLDDNTDTDAVPVTFDADLSITKSHNPEQVRVSDLLEFTLQVRNDGPTVARNVVVTDDLPEGLAFVTAAGTGDPSTWECSYTEPKLTCVLDGTLAAGTDAEPIRLTTRVGAAAYPEVTNVGTVTSDTPDSNDENNEWPDEVIVPPAANVSIAKSANKESVHAGSIIEYTLTATNDGPATAADVVVSDDLPDELDLISVTFPDGWTCNQEDPVVCSIASLPAKATAEITVRARVASQITAGTDITNTARIETSTDVDDPDDNEATVVVPVTVLADLKLVKEPSHGDQDWISGGSGEFTFTVTNDGPSDAVNLVLTDQLEDYLSFESGPDPAASQWTCSADAANLVTCSRPGSMQPGASESFTIRVNVAAGHTGPIGNEAPVDSDTPGEDGTDSTEVPSAQRADLGVEKTGPASANAGDQVEFSLTVTNHGESDSPAPDAQTEVPPITVVDTLPAGMRAVGADGGDDWDCSVDDQVVTCGLLTGLKAKAVAPVITVTAVIDTGIAAESVLTNLVTVEGPLTDPIEENDSDTFAVEITTVADVTIVKTVDSEQADAGTDVTYTLKVRNAGPSDARPVVVTDLLLPELTLVSATVDADGWSCAPGTTVSCEGANLKPGEANEVTITVVARIASGVPEGRPLTNIANVHSPTDPSDSTDDASVLVQTKADLGLVKTAGEAEWLAGGLGEYTFTVSNYGVSDALAPWVHDQLPADVSFVSVIAGGDLWACSQDDANLLSCVRNAGLEAGTAADPAQDSFTIQVRLAAGHTGPVKNAAEVGSATEDPEPGNNPSVVTVFPGVRADLGIVKTGPASVIAGEQAEFSLLVTNHGESDSPAPDAVEGVAPITVVDTLPSGFSDATADGGEDWNCSVSGQVVTCELLTGLKAEESAPVITVTAVVDTNVPDQSVLTNAASVDGPLTDPVEPNDTDSVDVQVSALADLTITKTSITETVYAGGQVEYLLKIHNAGPSDAVSVAVSDDLPDGLTLVSAEVDAAGWTCEPGDVVACTGESLAPGTSHDVTIKVTAAVDAGIADGTEITNTATVHSPSDPSDDSDDATVPVVAKADLSLTKTHDPAQPVVAGGTVDYTLVAHNDGPSLALADVTITDVLPVGMTYVSSTGWLCAAGAVTDAGQTVTCRLPDGQTLAPGADSAPLVMTVQVAADLDLDTTTLVNTAEVTSGTPGEKGTATDEVGVSHLADLAITKTHDPAKVRVGEPLDFTLQVTNTGLSVAREVVVVDTLPVGVDYVSAVGDGWSCELSGRALGCSLDDPLAAGASATPITVRVSVQAAAFPSVTNVAVVSTITPEVSEENNTASDQVDVPAMVDLGIAKTHQPEPLQVGGEATYTLTVTNSGPTADPGPVTVTDSLPAGLKFRSAGADGWTCAANGQDVSCVLPTGLAAGATSAITVVVDVLPAAYPAVSNTAAVSSAAEDINLANNTATDPATVLPNYNLGIEKDLDNIVGRRAVWTIMVTNSGPYAAPNGVTITDDLPSVLTFDTYTGDGWTCSAVGQLVTCDHPAAIEAGQSVSVTLATTIEARATGTVVNTASIVGGASDSAEGELPKANDGDGDSLAYTGGAAVGAGLLGLVLLGGGALLLTVRRRRHG